MITSIDELKDFKSIFAFFKTNKDKLNNHREIIDFLFDGLTMDQILNREVVVYGAGQFGRQVNRILKLIGVNPICFATTSASDTEARVDGLRVLNIKQLLQEKSEALILIASPTNAASIKKNLLVNGFSTLNIYFPKNVDAYSELYFGDANYFVLRDISSNLNQGQSIEKLIQKYSKLADDVNDKFFDEKSKKLLWAVVVQTIFWDDIGVFRLFMSSFSEPIRNFGTRPFAKNGPENYFYFNNEIFKLSEDEVYVDIGAFDGDSINEFISSNKIKNLSYRKIIAFEPDHINYAKLKNNISSSEKIVLRNLGVSNKSGSARFISSVNSPSPTGSTISAEGDIEVQLVALDDYLNEEKISLIKMDPPGENLSDNILNGAKRTIFKHRPKIIIGIHSLQELYDLVNKVTSSFPFYNLYLRHNSWGAGEVDLYLIPKLEN
jgi:FkbM family methyltransferase